MPDQAAEQLVKNHVHELLKSVSLKDGLEREYLYLTRSYGRNCLLLGWSDPSLSDAVAAIAGVVPKVSAEAIRSALTHSIVSLFEHRFVREDADPEAEAPMLESLWESLDKTEVSDEADRLIERLRCQPTEWTAFVFLEGIEVRSGSVSLGTTSLYSPDEGPLGEFTNEAERLILPPSEEVLVRQCADMCRCYCAVPVSGESGYADQEAVRKAQRVAAVLSICLPVLSPHDRRKFRKLGLHGYVDDDRCRLVLKCTPPMDVESDKRRYTVQEFREVFFHTVDHDSLQSFAKPGVEVIVGSLMAGADQATGAPARIRNAVTWFSRAMSAATSDERFVGLMIALESLLVADENPSAITQRLADGVSSLLGTNFENRQRLAAKVKDLYRRRGHIVHRAVPASLESLWDLNVLVAETIWEFARRELEH